MQPEVDPGPFQSFRGALFYKADGWKSSTIVTKNHIIDNAGVLDQHLATT